MMEDNSSICKTFHYSLNTIFERAQAEIVSLAKWDERRLAYPVAGHGRGTYILSYFRADPGSISGIERDVLLNETLLRVLILSAEKIPQAVIDGETPAARVDRENAAAEARAAENAAKAAAEAASAIEPEQAEDVAEAPEDVAIPEEAKVEPVADIGAEDEPQEPNVAD